MNINKRIKFKAGGNIKKDSKKLRERYSVIKFNELKAKRFKKSTINLKETVVKLAHANLLTVEKTKGQIRFSNTINLIGEIKQLYNVVHFLLELKKRKKQKLPIRIVVSNRFLHTMLKRYLFKLNRFSSIKITRNLLRVKPNTILFILLEYFNRDREVILKGLILKKVYVFFTQTGIFGTYNLFLKDFNLKRLFFFVTLLNKILTHAKNK